MEGSYYYYSDGENQSHNFTYEASEYNDQASIEVWSDPDYDEGINIYSSPQQPVGSCCVNGTSTDSSDFEQSPDCSNQDVSSESDAASQRSESTESEWETDSSSSSAASVVTGISGTGSAVCTDSCRNSEASSSSWETASTDESNSSWETATTCSCEAAETSAASLSCRPAEERMSHPFPEGGGSGSLVPLLPSVHLRAPPQQLIFRRWRKMNSSGVGRRQERGEVSEQKQSRRTRTVRKVISAPADPIAARKANPAQRNRPRRYFRWNQLRKKKRKARTDAVKIGGGVAGPSGENQ